MNGPGPDPHAAGPAPAFAASTAIAWGGVVLLALVWSANWIVRKVATDYSGPVAFTFQSYVIGTVVVFLVLRARGRLAHPPWLPTVAVGLAQTCASQALVQAALTAGGVGRTVVLAYSMPFWVVPIAWWWLHERITVTELLCIALGAAGILLVIGPGFREASALSAGLALLGGLTWGIATVLSRYILQRHPETTPLGLTAWQMLFGTIALLVLLPIAPERAIVWSRSYVIALAYNGAVASGLCWVVWTFVIQRLGASIAGLTSLAVPALGAALAWLLLRERPSLTESVGIALALLAVALLALSNAHSGNDDAHNHAGRPRLAVSRRDHDSR